MLLMEPIESSVDMTGMYQDATRLQAAVPDIPIQHISEAIHGVFKRMKVNLKTGQPMRL